MQHNHPDPKDDVSVTASSLVSRTHTPVSIFIDGISVKMEGRTAGGSESSIDGTIKRYKNLISEVTATIPGGSLFAILGGSGSGEIICYTQIIFILNFALCNLLRENNSAKCNS